MCPETRLPGVIGEFKSQLLRWNPQINLISRQATDQIVDRLIIQGQAGIEAVVRHLRTWGEFQEGNTSRSLNYFDLGSGGGIPGIIWHCMLSEWGFSPYTYLVEPREKRAWFLERLVAIQGMEPFRVLCQRWGDDFNDNESPCMETGPTKKAVKEVCGDIGGNILISLKALRLSDKQILAGLSRAGFDIDQEFNWEGRRLLIARYYPPGQGLDPELLDKLGITDPEGVLAVGGLAGRANGSWVDQLYGDTGPCASLVFSEYCLNNLKN
ncbi:MAG: class I SAM-dependent methyltransferase [Gemmatimonadales bacterium]|nr:class I SAM-dependent methyltransferase [Gemmatimonadales bacterium]